MERVLTGIQSSGKPHLGNILGAMLPAINLAEQTKGDALFFIADLHSLTTIKDAKVRIDNVYSVAAAWLAFGFDSSKNILYRQSRIREVNELTWYLSCYTKYPLLANAHSFKSKADKLSDVNAGLFIYPVLMAADILMYDAHLIPVGKDQKQHIEIARDIAVHFNSLYGDIFVIPEPIVKEEIMTIPGVDGQKMSKSYKNIIDVFLPEKELKKQVMCIITDSKGVADKKDPDTCTVFKLYALLAEPSEISELREKYLNGNYGYGSAKTDLLKVIMRKFEKERIVYNKFMSNLSDLEDNLRMGEIKAKEIALTVLERVRTQLGF